jgi:bacillopeptidase F
MRKWRVSIPVLLVVVMLVLVAACDDNNNPSTPTSTKAIDTMEPKEALTLVVNEPQNETVVDTSRITISGTTRSDAVVSINGVITDVDSQGGFIGEVNLDIGPNSLEIIASDFYGNEETAVLTIVYATALPLIVTEPLNGSVVTSNKMVVRGTTNSDAVLSINGQIVAVDAAGGFSEPVILQEGPNLIEVIANDFDGNSTTMMTTVMLVP